jgi:hypothetical protein
MGKALKQECSFACKEVKSWVELLNEESPSHDALRIKLVGSIIFVVCLLCFWFALFNLQE